MRKTLVSFLCPLIALAAVLGAADQADAQVWSLADDFSYVENSDTSTWSYRLDDNAGTYPLLTTNTRNAMELWGTAFPDPPLMWSDAEGYWGVGKNLSGVMQSASGEGWAVDWAPDEILFHPQAALPGRMAFSWLSPVDMTVAADYTFGSAMNVGNGIGYRIVHNSGEVDTTLIDFSEATYVGMGSRSGSQVVTVAAGDRLNFSFDNWGDAGGDITRAAITIEEYAPPEPYTLPYAEDFSGFTNPQTFGEQYETGLQLTWGGNVPGWTDDNPSHTADLDPDPEVTDIAMMFWTDYNRMTLDTGILANDLGTIYEVSFDAGPTVYAAGVQATGPDSGLVIDILNASDEIIESFTHLPGAWAGSQELNPASFTYTGDGDGPMRIRIQSNNYPGQFGGAIDNLSVDVAPDDLVLVWNGDGPGSWDSANWESPDGTPTTAVPNLDRFITVTTNVVTVDGLADAEARSLDVIDDGGIAIAEGKTLHVATSVDFQTDTTLTLGNNATLKVGDGGALGQVAMAGNATVDTGGPTELEALDAGGSTGVFAKQGDGELSLLSASNTSETTFEVRAGALTMVGESAWGESTQATLAGGTLVIEGLAESVDLPTKNVVVTADSTLDQRAGRPVTLGGLTMAEGTLTTAGSPVSFTGGTLIDPADGVTTVGINSQTTTDLGPIDGNGAMVDIVKTGTAALALDDAGVNLDDATFIAAEGRLIAYHGSNPFGGATLKTGDGLLVLSAKPEATSPVVYNNAVIAETNGRISAGPGDAGHLGPMTVNLGSDSPGKGFQVNQGVVVELMSEPGYELNVASTIDGDGQLVVNQGTVTLSGDSSSVGSLEVAGATVSTAGKDLSIRERLKVGDVAYSVNGATFAARGADLAAGVDLTLSGGQVTFEEPGQPWSLADDFSYTENSDTSTWSYRRDDNAGTYPLLTTNTRNALEIWGTAFPDPPLMWSDAEGYWGVGKNLSGEMQSVSGGGWAVDWAPDEVLFHPENAIPGRLVFSWLAPADMTVDAEYTFGEAMGPDTGNGIGYSIVHRNTGGDTTLIDWTEIGLTSISGSLEGLEVAAGDRLNFSFDNWGDAGGDISRAAITIQSSVGMVDQPDTNLIVTADTELTSLGPSVALGDLTIEDTASTLTLSGAEFAFDDVTTPQSSTIAGIVLIQGNLNIGGSLGVLHGEGELEFDMGAVYKCEIGQWDSLGDPWNPIPPGGPVNDMLQMSSGDAFLGGDLELRAITKLQAPTAGVQWYGEQTRTITSAMGESSITYAFDSVPEALPEDFGTAEWGQGHIGRGVFLTRHNNGGEDDVPGVSYSATGTDIHLFQALDGDTNGDAILDTGDIFAILGAGSFLTPGEWDWTEGDFDGDTDVDTDDIFAILATGQWGDFTPYYPESGKVSAAKGEADAAVVDLIVNPETGEVSVDTNGAEITGYMISSELGALTGEAATQFTLSEQSADQIADMLPLGKAFAGVHDLGSVLDGDGSDLTLTYTLAGQAGVFQGNIKVVPEPGTLAMLLAGMLGIALAAYRRNGRRG